MSLTARRAFLQSAAVSIAAVSADRVLGANDRLQAGFIGLGGRGSWLHRMVMRRAEEHNDVAIVALCDVYARRLAQAKERTPEAQTYVHHPELLRREGLDVVFIATPDHWHAPITLAAMQQGLDVYCEKPMTHTWEEARQVVHAAQKQKRILQIGVQALSWTKWHKAKELVDQGMVGKVVCCQGTYSRNAPGGDWNWPIDPAAGPDGKGDDYIDWKHWLGSAPAHKFDPDRFFRFRKYWDYSGGIATDLHYHTVAPFHLAVKNEHPSRVAGMGGIWIHNDGRETPDTFLTAADYPTKWSLTVQSSQANAVGPRTLIRGEKATLYCGADWEGESYGLLRVVAEEPFKDEFKQKWGKEEIVVPDIQDEGDEKHVANFIECVRSRRQTNCNPDIAFTTMTAIALSVRGCREGKVFYCDGEKEAIFSHPIKM
ncbi:MAG: gfo/Idh/MocA family oxidoreductase [bacterium]|nr:gfo/Idh/MocA family oxidoreductase [bacterium]